MRAFLSALLRPAAHTPIVGRIVLRLYQRRGFQPAWRRVHPFDVAYGVDTSGFVPGALLAPGSTGYGAAQPSIVRRALEVIPNRETAHFVDLGCGKGRPLLIAAEAGFVCVTGVEFTPELARIARRNAENFARTRPSVRPIEIVTGDALAYALPLTRLVVFLYHPFERPLIARVLLSIETSLTESPRDAFVVYYNPVWADVFDASSMLERRHAAQYAYDEREVGYGPNESDAVVVWQNRGNRSPIPPGVPDAPVVVVSRGNRAVIGG